MKNLNLYLVFITLTACLSFKTYGACLLDGEWIIKKGRLFKNYEMARSYSVNRVKFAGDSVELASGFFYNILSLDAPDWRIGKYPFIYYGKKERFKIMGDSLFVYSSPYKVWERFRISCRGKQLIILSGKNSVLELVKPTSTEISNECTLKYITVDVDDGPMSTYNVRYKATYTSSDSLFFVGMDSVRKPIVETQYELRTGTFSSICGQLSRHLQLLSIVREFRTAEYDFGRVYLEIGLNDGRIIKAEIHNKECPEELWFSLIPVLYGHQRFMYKEFIPVEF